MEPSPVEETPADSGEGDYFNLPTASFGHSSNRSNTATLGLGNHSLNFYRNFKVLLRHTSAFLETDTTLVRRIQKYSSYAFSIFAAFHITNTSILPLVTQSLPESDRYLLLTRPYYQSTIAEPLLVGIPVVLHVASGLALRIRRRRRLTRDFGGETRADRKKIRWPQVSGTSALGLILIPLISSHAMVNRGLPLKVTGGSSDVGLRYVAHGFARLPVVSFTAYSCLVLVGVWHVIWGWAKWLGWTPDQVTEIGSERLLQRKKRWYGINGIAVAVACVWGAGGLGVVGRDGLVSGWLGKEYDELYRHIPLLGRWV